MPWVVHICMIFTSLMWQWGWDPTLGRCLGTVIPENTDNGLRNAGDEVGPQCCELWFREIFLGESCSSRQENQQLSSLIPGYFCKKAFSPWPSAVTNGLTAIWGETTASQLSTTWVQGSVFKLSRHLPGDQRGNQYGGMPGPEGHFIPNIIGPSHTQ